MNIPSLVHFLNCCKHLLCNLDQSDFIRNGRVLKIGVNLHIDELNFDVLTLSMKTITIILWDAFEMFLI